MEELSLSMQQDIEGGFALTASTVAALVALGLTAVGIYKMLTSKTGKVKLPFAEFEWALNQGLFDQIAQSI